MQALFETDQPGARDIARRRIGRDGGRLFEAVTLHLFDNQAGECSLVDRLYYITKSDFFTGFPLETMVPLILAADLSQVKGVGNFRRR